MDNKQQTIKKRIFIAVNLTEQAREELLSEQKEIPREMPVKLTREDNLHITLCFLGSMEETRIAKICEITSEIAEKHSGFSINLNRIDYGPPGIIPPRMIWAIGALNKELSEINQELELKLLGKKNHREFLPHITLGRIREWQWRQIDVEERPLIEKDISINFEVKSIDVMESQLKRTGAEYSILKSFPLKQ
jgi:2'-5' RNA ligase